MGLKNILWLLLVLVCGESFGTGIRFLTDLNIPTDTKLFDTPFGGISGIFYDSPRNELICLSDDRSKFAPARYYTFAIDLSAPVLKLIPKSMTPLKTKDGKLFPQKSVDPEGFTINSDGTIYFSSEGDLGSTPKIKPGIFQLDRRGKVIGELPIPKKFFPRADNPDFGAEDNMVFEGLSTLPDSNLVFAATEGALLQDDTQASFKKGAWVRFLRFDRSSSESEEKKVKEFAYRLDAIPKVSPDPAAEATNGVSEILALGEERLLVLERGGAGTENDWTNIVKLYEIDTSRAKDVSSWDSLKGKRFRSAVKKLVLDFSKITDHLSPGFQSIDNLEAMSFGPRLKNGHLSLIVASDNNFSEKQRTQFLVFELIP